MKASFDVDEIKPEQAIEKRVAGILELASEGSVIYCLDCQSRIYPGKIYLQLGRYFQESYPGILCQRCFSVVGFVKEKFRGKGVRNEAQNSTSET